jgi:hypothetical protein
MKTIIRRILREEWVSTSTSGEVKMDTDDDIKILSTPDEEEVTSKEKEDNKKDQETPWEYLERMGPPYFARIKEMGHVNHLGTPVKSTLELFLSNVFGTTVTRQHNKLYGDTPLGRKVIYQEDLRYSPIWKLHKWSEDDYGYREKIDWEDKDGFVGWVENIYDSDGKLLVKKYYDGEWKNYGDINVAFMIREKLNPKKKIGIWDR